MATSSLPFFVLVKFTSFGNAADHFIILGFIELNARTNSFIDHLSLNLFRSSYPIGRSDNSASQSRSWNRSSANRNAGASTLTWQLVGRKWYGYALNLSTEKPFEVSFKNLADATLRIVTIEEHPFVIKKVSFRI